MGQVDGSYSCNNGDFGSFTIYEMQVNITGVHRPLNCRQHSARVSCSGWLGGMRSVFLTRIPVSHGLDARYIVE